MKKKIPPLFCAVCKREITEGQAIERYGQGGWFLKHEKCEEVKKVIENFVFGTCCYGDPKAWYTFSLLNTYRHLMMDHLNIWPEHFYAGGLYIISSRNILVTQVQKWNQTVPVSGIFWIDADMAWEPSDVIKVLDIAEKNPEAVVGCLYSGREGEMTVGRVFDTSSDVSEALHLGFGFTYTPLSCFNGPSPWFFNAWEGEAIVGEDVFFCREQIKSGRKILAITESNVGHSYEPGPRKLRGKHAQVIGDKGVRYL